MTWKRRSVEAVLGVASKVSSVSSHQMSGFNLSQCAWGKVMIQMLSPFLTGLQLSMGEKERERGGQSGCPPPPPPYTYMYSDTQVYFLIYNERACPTELRLICRWGGGTGWDDLGHLGMADRIYILTVALRWLNKSQCTSFLWHPFSKWWQFSLLLSSSVYRVY